MERLELLANARGAYERGRRRLAWRTMLLSVPMAGLALLGCHHVDVGVPLGMTLVVISAVLAWRGGVAGRAVTTGLFAGIAPMFLPLLASASCSIGGASVERLCFPACIAGGLIGGTILWSRASRVVEGRTEFVLVAGGLAAIAGSLGCVVLGVGGVVAMVAALAVLSVPAMLSPARAN